jgi:hypothetical protein
VANKLSSVIGKTSQSVGARFELEVCGVAARCTSLIMMVADEFEPDRLLASIEERVNNMHRQVGKSANIGPAASSSRRLYQLASWSFQVGPSSSQNSKFDHLQPMN